ncbi:MAG: MFS transporter [Bacteroidales bacterium]|jgi:GPH family glycoside/pentoside/hexuronide:cation symporter|nr:MFS transporter [Bacteroidales bacterium]
MNRLEKISLGEKIGYSLGDLAANLVFQTLITYLAYFYTDVYGLEPKVATLIIFTVGIVAAFLFNPIMGAVADRTKTRWGKFRPWILWTTVPLAITAILAFSTPDFSTHGKTVYAAVTYSLLLLLYAANNLPYAALSGVITGNMSERNSISSYRFVAVMLAQFFVQVFMYDIVLKVGGGDKALGFEKVVTFLAILGSVLLLITFFTTKERIVPKPEQNSSLKQDVRDLFSNKPWIIMLLVTISVFMTLSLKGGSYLYYFENYLNKQALAEFLLPLKGVLDSIGLSYESVPSMGFSVFNAGGILCMIIGIAFSRKLADTYGKRDVFRSALFLSMLFLVVFYFYSPYAILLVYISQILHGFFYGLTIPLLWAMIADVADFSEWKHNRRATGIIFSAMMVGLKAGMSLGQGLITWILDIFGYVPKSPEQTETAIYGIKLLISVFSALPFLVAVVLLLFYEIDKKMETQLETDLLESRK